jgi:hypothetical protein
MEDENRTSRMKTAKINREVAFDAVSAHRDDNAVAESKERDIEEALVVKKPG